MSSVVFATLQTDILVGNNYSYLNILLHLFCIHYTSLIYSSWVLLTGASETLFKDTKRRNDSIKKLNVSISDALII